MLHALLNHIDQAKPFETASAHCDIPCKIYDPISAQIAALTVIRMCDLIAELEDKTPLSIADQAQLARLVNEKESHAGNVKHEIRVIWGDYFKQTQFDQVAGIHDLVHSIMLKASQCKQHIDRQNGLELLALVNQFAEAFWTTKGLKTYTAQCPYPPAQAVVYPVLDNA
ncbi:superoxide dismutase, Ni [Neptunomonas sp. CHC150]|nr:superoxide dismutase, Ni [Neptunomonas sp. CHC150]MDN2659832.1 superoxide dismutase, Ni [Neptunomonas sp. CHC150]